MTKRREDKFICRCECGGQVRGIKAFDRMFTWCESCTPVQKMTAQPTPELPGKDRCAPQSVTGEQS